MALPAEKPYREFNYADYLSWDDGKRWELIAGTAYDMTPAPGRRHQWAVLALGSALFRFLEGKRCQVYVAPFDVRLPEPDETDETASNVVQPDIVVVCDRKKLDDRGCRGAPDLVIEVLSPHATGRDLEIKLRLYERHQVREYWIVDPWQKLVTLHRLGTDGKYRPTEARNIEAILDTDVLPGFSVPVATVLAQD